MLIYTLKYNFKLTFHSALSRATTRRFRGGRLHILVRCHSGLAREDLVRPALRGSRAHGTCAPARIALSKGRDWADVHSIEITRYHVPAALSLIFESAFS